MGEVAFLDALTLSIISSLLVSRSLSLVLGLGEGGGCTPWLGSSSYQGVGFLDEYGLLDHNDRLVEDLPHEVRDIIILYSINIIYIIYELVFYFCIL